MKTAYLFILALGVVMVVNANQPRVSAGEAASVPRAAPEAVDGRLASSAELDAISMSMIDRKIALSLAIEAHVQFELLESSLGAISDASLTRLVETKRQFHGSLFNTLNDLTGGRAANLIDQANGDQPRPGAAAAPIKTAHASKGGIRDVVDNATSSALLRVRLEIAEEYTDMLRAELQACQPVDFDRQFMAADLINQMQAVAILRVFEQQASEDFAKIIREARTLTENHLREGRQLAKRLDTGLEDETMARQGLTAGTPLMP